MSDNKLSVKKDETGVLKLKKSVVIFSVVLEQHDKEIKSSSNHNPSLVYGSKIRFNHLTSRELCSYPTCYNPTKCVPHGKQ